MAAEPSMTGGRGTRTNVLQLAAIGAIARVVGIALGPAVDWLPTPAWEQGEKVDTLWVVLTIFPAPVFVLVMVFVLYSVWRSRRRPGEEALEGPPIHGNTRLEI